MQLPTPGAEQACWDKFPPLSPAPKCLYAIRPDKGRFQNPAWRPGWVPWAHRHTFYPTQTWGGISNMPRLDKSLEGFHLAGSPGTKKWYTPFQISCIWRSQAVALLGIARSFLLNSEPSQVRIFLCHDLISGALVRCVLLWIAITLVFHCFLFPCMEYFVS